MLKSYLKIKVRLESWNSSFKCKKIPVFTMARKFAIRLAMKHQFNFWDRNVNININILSIPNVACCFVPNLIIILSQFTIYWGLFSWIICILKQWFLKNTGHKIIFQGVASWPAPSHLFSSRMFMFPVGILMFKVLWSFQDILPACDQHQHHFCYVRISA